MIETKKSPAKPQTVAEVYAAHKVDIASLLDLIGQEVDAHAAKAAENPGNWGLTGDLGHIRSELKAILSFLTMKGHQS